MIKHRKKGIQQMQSSASVYVTRKLRNLQKKKKKIRTFLFVLSGPRRTILQYM